MQNIKIVVSEAGSAQTRTFEYKVILDGEVVSERKLSPVQTSQVREMAMQYLSLLQGGSRAARARKVICLSLEPDYFISSWSPDGRISALRSSREREED